MEGTTWARGGAPRDGRTGKGRGEHPLIPRDGEKRMKRGTQGTRRSEEGRPTQEKKNAEKDCDWTDTKTRNEAKIREADRNAKIETAIVIGQRRVLGWGERSETETWIGQKRSGRTQARKQDGHCGVAVMLSRAGCWAEGATVSSTRRQVWEGGRRQAWEDGQRWRRGRVEAGCGSGRGPREA